MSNARTIDGWTVEARTIAPFTVAFFGGRSELSRLGGKHTFGPADSAAIMAMVESINSIELGALLWAAPKVALREPVSEESIARFWASNA